ncbi:hypothetical protein A33M_1247 [Rhodovulum sp. PH10]|nr:hypothetical protein A33M_1247 [Rhodovulum sp. PH10]
MPAARSGRASVCRSKGQDGRSQRGPLANNPPANADLGVVAVHGRAPWSSRRRPSRVPRADPASRYRPLCPERHTAGGFDGRPPDAG